MFFLTKRMKIKNEKNFRKSQYEWLKHNKPSMKGVKQKQETKDKRAESLRRFYRNTKKGKKLKKFFSERWKDKQNNPNNRFKN